MDDINQIIKNSKFIRNCFLFFSPPLDDELRSNLNIFIILLKIRRSSSRRTLETVTGLDCLAVSDFIERVFLFHFFFFSIQLKGEENSRTIEIENVKYSSFSTGTLLRFSFISNVAARGLADRRLRKFQSTFSLSVNVRVLNPSRRRFLVFCVRAEKFVTNYLILRFHQESSQIAKYWNFYLMDWLGKAYCEWQQTMAFLAAH